MKRPKYNPFGQQLQKGGILGHQSSQTALLIKKIKNLRLTPAKNAIPAVTQSVGCCQGVVRRCQ
jgi:hypothetical protein